MKERPQNKNYYSHVHVSWKKNGLRIDKMHQLISKENFEVVEKDQDLQQVVELKLEDTICQKFDEEVKEIKEVWVNCG